MNNRGRAGHGRPRSSARAPIVEALEGRLLLASINEFGAGVGLVAPTDIALGSDGNLWFGEATGKIGRVTPGGQITEFTAGITGAPDITGVAAGPDGNIWFTEYTTDRIGRITPQGVVTEFDLNFGSQLPFRAPARITAGSDGALWFTEQGSGSIGRITTQGAFTDFLILDATVVPTDIVTGPDGNLWFTETGLDTIGVMSTQGVVLQAYSAGITANASLDSITNGPDGALWFTEANTGNIGRITTAGAVTEFPSGNPSGRPNGIATGPDGNLYFAESQAGDIGRITTAGVVTRYAIPTAASLPMGVAVGSDLNLWFTEHDGNQIGQLVLPASITPAGATLAVFPGQDATQTFATFTDLSTGTVSGNFQAIINFGDGTTGPGFVVTSGPGQFLVRASHPYATAGNYSATITVGTDAGNAAPVSTSIVVTSSIVATGTNLAGFAYVPLSATFATFTDAAITGQPPVYTATIAFGDGTTGPGTVQPNGPGQFVVTATHTYTANTNYVATILVSNQFGSSSQATTPVAVATSITANPVISTVPAGRPINVTVAIFTDLATTTPASGYTATIDFGDGTSGPGTIQPFGNQFQVSAIHTYTAVGTYNTTANVRYLDDVAAPVLSTAVAQVGFYPIGTTLAAVADQPLTMATFARFIDFNTADTTPDGGYTATIDFGDGSTGPGTIQQDGLRTFAVNATHTYATAGNFVATITITDRAGITTSVTSTVAVSAAEPLSTVVTNTNDSGRGSLRQAILNANILPGLNTISFNIPGAGVKTIRPLTQLPPLTDQTIVDGATQAAFVGVVTQRPLIEVDGSALNGQSTGLRLLAGSARSTVADLAIFGFHGVQLDVVADNNVVISNYVGLRSDGTIPGTGGTRAVSDATYLGVLVHGFGNRIGGLAAGEGNVISGNQGQGLDFKNDGSFGTSGFHFVYGNIIGLDPTGTVARGNGVHGILIEGGVISTLIGAGNIISGNGGNGVELVGASSITIAGAFIGTDITGTKAIGNAGAGVCIDIASTFNQVGSSAAGTKTLISGNGFLGIAIRDGSYGNVVTNTWIGTDVTGEDALGNGSTGILITEAPSNVVGPNDVISGNGRDRSGAGVWIEGAAASGNSVIGSFIGTNATGTRRLGNAVIGVLINDAPSNVVGGTQAVGILSRNVISGNGQVGVMISGAGANSNRVEGNFIGTNLAGTGSIPNGQLLDGSRVGAGVYINGAPDNTIGGTDPAARNVISGNFAEGVTIFSAGATGNQVRNNFIGTDVTGLAPLGNGRDGLLILDASRNAVDGNVISGNRRNGLVISGSTSTRNVVTTNAIGVGASGAALGNGAYGVLFTDGARARSNTLAASNTIAHNGAGQVRSTTDVPSAPPLVVGKGHKAKVARARKIQPKAKSFGGRGLAAMHGKAKAHA